jgi:DNA-binding transcriptional MerR regulator
METETVTNVEDMTFGPAEVSLATGVRRDNLHSWLSRRYLSVESRGAGISRRFTFEQVAYVAAIASLERHGIPIGTAVTYLNEVKLQFYQAIREPRANLALVIGNGRVQIGKIGSVERLLSESGCSKNEDTLVYTILLLSILLRNLRHALRRVTDGSEIDPDLNEETALNP